MYWSDCTGNCKSMTYFWSMGKGHQIQYLKGSKNEDNTETMAVSVWYLPTRMSCHLAKMDTEPQNH